MLDKKLREILETIYPPEITADDVIAQIKQAFAEEPGKATWSTDPLMMTGKEWLARFKAQKLGLIFSATALRIIMEAARKAAGLKK